MRCHFHRKLADKILIQIVEMYGYLRTKVGELGTMLENTVESAWAGNWLC